MNPKAGDPRPTTRLLEGRVESTQRHVFIQENSLCVESLFLPPKNLGALLRHRSYTSLSILGPPKREHSPVRVRFRSFELAQPAISKTDHLGHREDSPKARSY